MPCTPIAERASRTSSSLNGLMTAVTSFIFRPSMNARFSVDAAGLERLLNEHRSRGLADVAAGDRVSGVLGIGVGVVRAEVVTGHDPRHAKLPVGVVQRVAVA